MKISVKVAELFDCRISHISPFFEKFTYPWELLGEIKGYIQYLLEIGLPGYTRLRENVLVGEGVNIHPSAVIEGSAVIGAGTELRPGAFLRGNVITGEDCVIGNSSEIKNSILLECCQVPHYNYVGDSILGNRAHMGAGAICSNLKADKNNVVIHGMEDIPTGLRKVGAFLGDGADIGCGCVLNPGTVVGKNTSVYPLSALRGVYPSDCIIKSRDDICPRIRS